MTALRLPSPIRTSARGRRAAAALVGAVAVVGVVLVVPVVVGACFVQQRADAACQQMVLATCEARAHCGGVDAASCQADNVERTCRETPEDARRCVLAVNDVLAGECVQLLAGLPCPSDLLISGLYDACSADAECGVDPVPQLCLGGVCSEPCDTAEVRCPAQGACNVAAGRCEPECDDATQPCASDQVCVEARCLTCDEACAAVQCDSGTECSCGTCTPLPCDDGFDCPSEFGCSESVCTPCRRDESGQCVLCDVDGSCPEGLCAAGGLCV